MQMHGVGRGHLCKASELVGHEPLGEDPRDLLGVGLALQVLAFSCGITFRPLFLALRTATPSRFGESFASRSVLAAFRAIS